MVDGILTGQIRRKDRVRDPAMGMPGVPVVVVHFRMNVDQWNYEHPGRQPDQCRSAQPSHLGISMEHGDRTPLDAERITSQIPGQSILQMANIQMRVPVRRDAGPCDLTAPTGEATIARVRAKFAMNRTIQQFIAVGLTVCLLLLSGAVYVQALDHAAHHAHHQAATHSTALCSWLCAAGQSLEGVAFDFQAYVGLLALALLVVSQQPRAILITSPATRGPPRFSF
ncbi:MAG: hypothetical protein HY205_02715 [Nitrospirae bacterium]|nr:hypothetical protein [Nitrospirota bacterium]